MEGNFASMISVITDHEHEHEMSVQTDEYVEYIEGMPMIPTRSLQEGKILLSTKDPDEIPTWYVVLSPRETRGVSGPFNIEDLRNMHSRHEIGERTLAWKYGNKSWYELRHLPFLFPKVQRPPAVPPKPSDPDYTSLDKLESEIDRTSVPLDQIAKIQRLPLASLSRVCVKCGAFATVFTPGHGQPPLPETVSKPVRLGLPPQTVTEIVPGFLFVGNAASIKSTNIDKIGATLVVNCTEDMKTPPTKLPFYRCHRAPLKEWTNKPVSRVEDFSEEEIRKTFSAVCEYMEWERYHQEKVIDMDVNINSKAKRNSPPKYTGPVDAKGRPKVPFIPLPKPDAPAKPKATPMGSKEGTGSSHGEDSNQSASAAASSAATYTSVTTSTSLAPRPPRTLLFSRLGLDRPCAIAAAYLIKNYGVGLERALEAVKEHRGAMKISEPYMNALRSWEKEYALGETFCDDCIGYAMSRMGLTYEPTTSSRVNSAQNNINANASLMSLAESQLSMRGDNEEDGDEDTENGESNLRKAVLTSLQPFTGFGSEASVTSSLELSARDAPTATTSAIVPVTTAPAINDEAVHANVPELMSIAATYQAFCTKFKQHLEAAAIREGVFNTPAFALLGEPLTYLVPVAKLGFATGPDKDRRVDLKLGGKPVGDAVICAVFSALKTSNISGFLRDIDLQATNISCRSVIAMCEGFDSVPGTIYRTNSTHILVPAIFNLERLNLSHNQIGVQGCETLALLLRHCTALASMDLFGNPLGDAGWAALSTALIVPPVAFEEDDDGRQEEDLDYLAASSQLSLSVDFLESPITMMAMPRDKYYNDSLMELRLGNTGVGFEGVSALAWSLIGNESLTTLVLDDCPNMDSKCLKELMGKLSMRNSTLQKLSFTDTPLSVKSFGYILRLFESEKSVISHLDLTRCQLTSKHMSLLAKHAATIYSKLHFLNLSGNHFGDLGAVNLENFLNAAEKWIHDTRENGGIIPDNAYTYALQYLDISDCGLTSSGAVAIIEAISTNYTAGRCFLVFLDLSDNNLGPECFGRDSVTRKLAAIEGSAIPLGSETESGKGSANTSRLEDSHDGSGSYSPSRSQSPINSPGRGHRGTPKSKHASPAGAGVGENSFVSAGTPHSEGAGSNWWEGEESTDGRTADTTVIGITVDDIGQADAADIGNGVLGALSLCHLVELRLNRCNLQARGARPLMHLLATAYESTPLGVSLKSVSLSGNKISDSAGGTIKRLIGENLVLEVLDLSFNNISAETAKFISEASKYIRSDDDPRRKLVPLTVHAFGVPCDQYAIGLPSRARSKKVFGYGIKMNEAAPLARGRRGPLDYLDDDHDHPDVDGAGDGHLEGILNACDRSGMFHDLSRIHHPAVVRQNLKDVLAGDLLGSRTATALMAAEGVLQAIHGRSSGLDAGSTTSTLQIQGQGEETLPYDHAQSGASRPHSRSRDKLSSHRGLSSFSSQAAPGIPGDTADSIALAYVPNQSRPQFRAQIRCMEAYIAENTTPTITNIS